MRTRSKTKWTAAQKRIKKRLIDEDLHGVDIANFYGVSTAYISKQLMQEDEEYFEKAINALKGRNHFESQD